MADLPLVLAGPILRRVEPNLVAVWLATSQACTVKLALWENQIEFSDADEVTLFFRGPDAGTKTVRVGAKLHIVVVTARLPSGKTLLPERLYSYDVELTVDGQTTAQNLKTLGLLSNDPANADPDGDHTKHLALGYEPELLPCLLLPPNELKDLKLVHGSCRDTSNDFPDALAFLDDLLSKDKAYKSAIARPHQLFLTGDQIYADDVPRPLLHMLNNTAQTLMGATEQIPFTDHSQSSGQDSRPADLVNFPVGRRLNLVLNAAGMTSNDGQSHLFSFGEFCAMYLFVWSNVLWGDQLTTLPKLEELMPTDFDSKITSPALKDLTTKNDAGELVDFENYQAADLEHDIARLTEFHRTLPKVRRALANVPTYTIFDDHEITDDWFLNPTWRDRVLGSPLGNAIIRNGMLAYGLFQGWGNDPVKFEPRPGITEKQPQEQLLEQAAKFLPAGVNGPNADAASQIEKLLGLDLRNQIATDGSYAETNPPLKWNYTVPGQKHQVLVLDCRTRRAYASRISAPGNIGLTAQVEQIPEKPDPADKKVWVVVSSLPVMGPPIFDELLAPLLFRAFDFKDRSKLQSNRGQKRMPGTNPDAVEAWCFDPKLFEALIKRLVPYSPVVLLSGDVHYSASNAMTYWTKDDKHARFVQFVSSGLKNVMPAIIVFVDRSFAFAQKMIRSKIGAERLGWEKSSSKTINVPEGANVSPRLRTLLRKSPVLVPTFGWPAGATNEKPDWAWRVCPIRDTREEAKRTRMSQPTSLFPEDTNKKDNDLVKADLEGYHRVAERHSRELDRLNNCRQILFASSIALITFEDREDPDKHKNVTFAIQDMYAIHPDPEQLIGRPKPEIYTRHEVPLEDLWQEEPKLPTKKPDDN